MEFDVTRPKWPQIVDEIRDRIRRGAYSPGDRITLRDIETEFSVARATAQKVTAALERAGAVRTEQGMGSFVTHPSERSNS